MSFLKTVEEMLIRTQSTHLLQIVFELILYFEEVFKSTIGQRQHCVIQCSLINHQMQSMIIIIGIYIVPFPFIKSSKALHIVIVWVIVNNASMGEPEKVCFETLLEGLTVQIIWRNIYSTIASASRIIGIPPNSLNSMSGLPQEQIGKGIAIQLSISHLCWMLPAHGMWEGYCQWLKFSLVNLRYAVSFTIRDCEHEWCTF